MYRERPSTANTLSINRETIESVSSIRYMSRFVSKSSDCRTLTHSNANEHKECGSVKKKHTVQSIVAKWIKSAYKSCKLFFNRMRHNTHSIVCSLMVLCSVSLWAHDLFDFYRYLSPVTYATILICDFQFSVGYLFNPILCFICEFFLSCAMVKWKKRPLVATFLTSWTMDDQTSV